MGLQQAHTQRIELAGKAIIYKDLRLVPGGGLEPPWPEGRRILSPLRLPVPPSRPYLQVIDFTT